MELRKKERVCFAKETLDKLYKFVDQCDPDKDKHKEISGLFIPSGKGEVFLSIDSKSIVEGTHDGVDVSPGHYNFHSHPCGEYKRQWVKYGFPSKDDMLGILEKMCDPSDKTILHVVATLEGLYFICLSKELSIKDTSQIHKLCKAGEAGKYFVDLPDKNSKNGMTPKKYIQRVNKLKFKVEDQSIPIYKVAFKRWKQKGKKMCLDIYYNNELQKKS